jgi:hypothetical protein
MLGHYGWIMTFDEIDHPDVGKTGGRVYFKKRDIVKGAVLAQGDIVSFYLYADDQGLGAELCQLEQRGSQGFHASADELVPCAESFCQPESASFLADASDIVPTIACSAPCWNVCAAEFVPTSSESIQSCGPSSFNSKAAEFIPSTCGTGVTHDLAPGFGCSNPNVFAFNPAFFSDDESDDESVVNNDSSGVDADNESDDSDMESSYSGSIRSFQQNKYVEWSSCLDAVILQAPLKSPRASSADDSTSIGTSDCESEDSMRFVLKRPPGLSLPPGWRPPPGLTLSSLEA